MKDVLIELIRLSGLKARQGTLLLFGLALIFIIAPHLFNVLSEIVKRGGDIQKPGSIIVGIGLFSIFLALILLCIIILFDLLKNYEDPDSPLPIRSKSLPTVLGKAILDLSSGLSLSKKQKQECEAGAIQRASNR